MNRSKLFKECLKEVNAEIKTFEDLEFATELCLKQNKRNKENFYVRIKRKTDASKPVKKVKPKNKGNKKDGKKQKSNKKKKANKKGNKKDGKKQKNNKKNGKKKKEKDLNKKRRKVVKCKNNPKKSKNKIRNKRAGPDEPVFHDERGSASEVTFDFMECSDTDEVGSLGSPLVGPLEQGYI